MNTVTLSDAQAHLTEMVGKLFPGDEIIITQGDRPVARLLPVATARTPRPLAAFAGRFHPLPSTAEDDLKTHDRMWCGPLG